MINFEYKCIFVAVPKTASTSVRRIIGTPLKAHLDLMEYKEKLTREYHLETEHPKWNSVYRSFLSWKIREGRAERIFNTFFKFGFVRNPWDRVVSLYLRKQGDTKRHEMDFEQFVEWIQLSTDTCIHPSPKKNQLDWFLNKKGEIVADYIGKFETLEADWEVIREKLGIQEKLPHINHNPDNQRHYSTYYTDSTREIIREKFIIDIEHFGYTFEKM